MIIFYCECYDRSFPQFAIDYTVRISVWEGLSQEILDVTLCRVGLSIYHHSTK